MVNKPFYAAGRAGPKRMGRLWRILALVSLFMALAVVVLVSGTWRDPTGSLHAMVSSAVWTTFGPHFVVISAAALVLGGIAYWRCRGRLALATVLAAIAAVSGSAAITARIVSAASAAGGSADPIQGLWLKPMQAAGPDEMATFATVDGQALHVAIYRPKRTDRSAPVLFYIHGGGYMTGTAVETDSDLRWFADQGWLVFSAEYRLWTRKSATWDKAPEDVACAAAWIGSNAGAYGGQAQRLAILGDSAGGGLAINLAYAAALEPLRSECGAVPVPDAVVVQYPAVDPLSIYEHGYPVSGFEPRMLVSGYLGGDPYALPERVRAVSSYTYLSDKAPPTLVLAPENDALVPSWSVYRFADQARFAGVDVELVRIPFASHVYNQMAANSIGNQARLSVTRRYLLERGLGPGPAR